MNLTPYETPTATTTDLQALRSVRGMLAWAIFFAIGAYQALASALQMFNQELGLFPVNHAVYDVEINGVAVSNDAFAWSSLFTGAFLLSIALVLSLRARRNYKHNVSASRSLIVKG